MNILSKSGIVAGLILAMLGTMNVAHAGFEKFFIKGNPASCDDAYASMNAQHGFTFGPAVAEVPVPQLMEDQFFDIFGGPQVVEISNVPFDGTSFDWEEIAPSPPLGFNLICIKAGNGRTCYVPTVEATSGTNFQDLNTTSKINSARFCATETEPAASGGPQCNLFGDPLFDLFNAVGGETAVTIYDGSGIQVCYSPIDGVIESCDGADAYAPIGDTGATPIDGDGICDPDTEICCTIDATCTAEDFGDSTTREDCPLLPVSGPTEGAGYSQGGNETCFYVQGAGGLTRKCF